MSDTKKEWTKPQLIVLARGTPEEAVLEHCKRIGEQFIGPNGTTQEGCNAAPTKDCGNCHSRSMGS